MQLGKRIRALIRSDVRQALDGIALYFAITLFFCLIASAINGVVNRNPDFDRYRWWYPIYKTIQPYLD